MIICVTYLLHGHAWPDNCYLNFFRYFLSPSTSCSRQAQTLNLSVMRYYFQLSIYDGQFVIKFRLNAKTTGCLYHEHITIMMMTIKVTPQFGVSLISCQLCSWWHHLWSLWCRHHFWSKLMIVIYNCNMFIEQANS